MKRRTIKILSLLLVAVLLLTGIQMPVSAGPMVDKEKPDDSTYLTIDGEVQGMYSESHELTIAIFTSVDCLASPRALEYLQRMKLPADKVDICSIDTHAASKEDVREYAEELQTPRITFCYDSDTRSEYSGYYGKAHYQLYAYTGTYFNGDLPATPTYVFTDSTGKVLDVHVGTLDTDKLAELLEDIGYGHLLSKGGSSGSGDGVSVAYRTQDEIREYAKRTGVTLDDDLEFEEEPLTEAPYSLGKLSGSTSASALAMLNQVRYIAGISDNVELSEDYNELAQGASLVNYVNGSLTHYPEQPSGMSDEMYSIASRGAASSNLLQAPLTNYSMNNAIIANWMNDGDESNISMLGHRRWILNPSMGKTGFGAVSGENATYSAVYARDQSNLDADEYGVMWPAQNMPTEYFAADYPWSISMGYKVDINSVRVRLMRESDGKTWKFSKESADGDFYIHNEGYGQSGCIIFRPDSISGYRAGDAFRVEITGLPSGNDVSYTVHFFNLDPEPDPETLHNPYYDGAEDVTVWSYVYMGSYPQTEITDKATKQAIDAAIETGNTDDGIDVWVKTDGSMDRYRKVKIASTVRYFKWEPIKWRVLYKEMGGQSPTLFLMADQGLDTRAYDTKGKYDWETCTLRPWLNDEFYNLAFGSVAQKAISETAESLGAADKVFLLTKEDMLKKKYGFNNLTYESSKSRVVKPTDYTSQKGDVNQKKDGGWWWLANDIVSPEGTVIVFGNAKTTNSYFACVPAVRVRMSAEGVWSTRAGDVRAWQNAQGECQEKLKEYESKLADYDDEARAELEALLEATKSKVEGALAKGDLKAAEDALAEMEVALEEKAVGKKEEAKKELQQIQESLADDEELDDNQRAEIEEVIREAEKGIADAKDATAVREALEKVKQTIEDIKQKNRDLKAVKEEVRNQIDTWNEDDFLAQYGEEEQAAIKRIAEKLAEDIADKTEPSEIQELLDQAKADVEALKTEEQKQKEAEESLKQAKSAALKELDALLGKLGPYRIPQQDKIITAIEEAQAKIEAAKNVDEVNEALEAAKQVFREQPTDAELKKQEEAAKKDQGGSGTGDKTDQDGSGTGNKTSTASLTLDKTAVTLYTGKASNSETVTPTVTGKSKTVTWKTSNSKVATVKNGKITAVGKGTATVTATANKISKTVQVTVKDPTLTIKNGKKKFTKSKLTVKKNKKVVLTVTVDPKDSGISITRLTKKQKKIASVTLKKGKITIKGKQKGSFTLQIKSGKAAKKIKITVK